MALVCAVTLTSCADAGKNAEEATKTVFAMDTVMELKAYGKNAERALSEAEQEIIRLDNMLSRGTAGSEIYKINELKNAEVSTEAVGIINAALSVSASTDGAFDITIAPIMDLWGFFTKDFRVPSDEEIAAALEKVDYRNVSAQDGRVSLRSGAQIDLGGIAKGYLSGRIMEIFKGCGVSSGIVSLGGNVHALGKKPDGSKWRVAIQNPDGGDFLGTLAVEDTAVITSGGYQRFFEQDGRVYHHIIDPATGYPAANGLKSVSVISGSSDIADGLSTALYVMGQDGAAEYWRSHGGFEAVLMTDDGRIFITKGLENIWESGFGYEVIE